MRESSIEVKAIFLMLVVIVVVATVVLFLIAEISGVKNVYNILKDHAGWVVTVITVITAVIAINYQNKGIEHQIQSQQKETRAQINHNTALFWKHRAEDRLESLMRAYWEMKKGAQQYPFYLEKKMKKDSGNYLRELASHYEEMDFYIPLVFHLPKDLRTLEDEKKVQVLREYIAIILDYFACVQRVADGEGVGVLGVNKSISSITLSKFYLDNKAEISASEEQSIRGVLDGEQESMGDFICDYHCYLEKFALKNIESIIEYFRFKKLYDLSLDH